MNVTFPKASTVYVPTPEITSGVVLLPVFEGLFGSIKIIVDGSIDPSKSESLLVISETTVGLFCTPVAESLTAKGASSIGVTIISNVLLAALLPSVTEYVTVGIAPT